jgi:hypothetical protein
MNTPTTVHIQHDREPEVDNKNMHVSADGTKNYSPPAVRPTYKNTKY